MQGHGVEVILQYVVMSEHRVVDSFSGIIIIVIAEMVCLPVDEIIFSVVLEHHVDVTAHESPHGHKAEAAQRTREIRHEARGAVPREYIGHAGRIDKRVQREIEFQLVEPAACGN